MTICLVETYLMKTSNGGIILFIGGGVILRGNFQQK
jgi:hypothetical protein